ncbi:hypothetical protein OBBRIDRAFT_66304 [Obba rivulosa]|uniref:Uncharacterized protein n=1 Tax=Obba rivulosa TaxID=1052685 RepID=A0A8E2AUW8_9APHY|nr:hypothetical protein OBBRIDRAFT_66304 [Obba rivulosa]
MRYASMDQRIQNIPRLCSLTRRTPKCGAIAQQVPSLFADALRDAFQATLLQPTYAKAWARIAVAKKELLEFEERNVSHSSPGAP